MSGVSLSPETMSGPFYVTSEKSKPPALQDDVPITGAMYVQGPVQIGNDGEFSSIYATLMVGPLSNNQTSDPSVPGSLCTGVNNPYSLCVSGNASIFDNLDVANNIAAGNDIVAQGEVKSRCGSHILSAKKNFDIPHPSKEGWRLRHTCPEGPSNDVYIRGRVTNKTEIQLPEYWTNLVDPTSVTVSLTPIGAHQDVIVKRIGENKVFLQSKGNMPIDCFYHIFAERCDGEKLISEYQGESPADYPGNNDEYSVSGYHYDVK
jgi:hypothetical protein